MRQFLSCFPKPSQLLSDYGVEFSSIFTTELQKYGITQHEGISQRSQSQGSAKLGVKLVKMTLNKMIGMESNQGRDYWTKMIPHVVQRINSTHPYQMKLSRIHLLFSPLYHLNETLLVPNPMLLQAKCYEDLNKIRTANLLQKSNTRGKHKYVFLSDDNVKTINKSRQLVNPINRDLYKILACNKDKFSFRLQNIRNQSERTVLFSELWHINLDDLLWMEIHPERFLNEARKCIRRTSYRTGNQTALKLIEM